MGKIKGKNFYREAITEVNKKNKNSCALKDLYKISDLFYRAYDDEMYKTLTNEEWDLLSCIEGVLRIPKHAAGLKIWIRTLYF